MSRHHLFGGHSDDHADSVDDAMESSRQGIRAVKVSLLLLGATALLQALLFVVTGSVALLADTTHNVSDALTAVPLWIAFVVGRRPATRAYTYGYGRAEDFAGVFIVAMIAASALVAWYRIRVGQRIGSAALVADGQHARADGFTSLAVVGGAVGALAGFPLADPIIGLAITAAILFVLRDAARQVYRRLMDAVDPDVNEAAERELLATPGVEGVTGLQVRRVGHRLRGEAGVLVTPDLDLATAHGIAHDARARLIDRVPRMDEVTVHVSPGPIRARTGSRPTAGAPSRSAAPGSSPRRSA